MIFFYLLNPVINLAKVRKVGKFILLCNNKIPTLESYYYLRFFVILTYFLLRQGFNYIIYNMILSTIIGHFFLPNFDPNFKDIPFFAEVAKSPYRQHYNNKNIIIIIMNY